MEKITARCLVFLVNTNASHISTYIEIQTPNNLLFACYLLKFGTNVEMMTNLKYLNNIEAHSRTIMSNYIVLTTYKMQLYLIIDVDTVLIYKL